MTAAQPTGNGCPKCGSGKFKFAPLKPAGDDLAQGLFKMRDRICKDCGTQYTPAMPGWIPYVIVVGGVALAFVGVMGFFIPLMNGPVEFRSWVKVAFILVGVGFVGAGVRLIAKKKP